MERKGLPAVDSPSDLKNGNVVSRSTKQKRDGHSAPQQRFLHNRHPIYSTVPHQSSAHGDSIETLMHQAKLAELARRYMEMLEVMTTIAEQKEACLSDEERNLFGIACKNVISSRRVSWRILMSKEANLIRQNVEVNRRGELAASDEASPLPAPTSAAENESKSPTGVSLLRSCKQYRLRVEREISEISIRILKVISKHILPKTDRALAQLDLQVVSYARRQYKDVKEFEEELRTYFRTDQTAGAILRSVRSESIVFYYKMKGDIFRYLVETCSEYRKGAQDGQMALGFYLLAMEVATAHLYAGHPIRLGLVLNLSVFYHQILSVPARACEVAKNAFDEAVFELPEKDTIQYSDSSLIMTIIRDNLQRWTKRTYNFSHSPVRASSAPMEVLHKYADHGWHSTARDFQPLTSFRVLKDTHLKFENMVWSRSSPRAVRGVW